MAASEDQNRSGIDEMQDSELEQYGVWVKAGPEDVDETEAEDEAFALADLEDEELEGASDILSPDEGLDEGAVDLGEELELESLDLDEDILEGGPGSDAGAFEVEFEESAEVSNAETPEDDDEEVFEEDLLTLEEDDVSLDLGDESEELGVDTVVNLEESEPLAAEPLDELDLSGPTAAPAEDETSGISIEDDLPGDLDDLTLDLDSLDVDSYDETPGEPSEQPDEEDELEELDLTTPAAAETEAPREEDEDATVAELDLSTLPGEDDEFGALDEADVAQAGGDDLPELELDDDLAIEDDLTTGFDDVGAVEEEMTGDWEAETPSPEAAAVPGLEPPETASDPAAQSLLASIERELSSIRTELADLKSELSHLRAAPATPTAAPPTEVSGDDDAAGGFFEDEGDDDETIALTGAELDNIMNTAEFTEETGQPTNYDEESSSTQPVQEITLEDAPEEADDLEIDLAGLGEETTAPGETGAEIELGEGSIFGGNEDEVESLAGMDIDSELADIDELEDTSTPPEFAGDDDEDVTLDAEPYDGETLDAEPIDLDLDDVPAEGDEPEIASEDEPLLDEGPTLEIGSAPELSLPEGDAPIPENLKGELRSVLNYMDKLLDSLPEEKIQEFAASEHFKVYKRLFEELGLEQ